MITPLLHVDENLFLIPPHESMAESLFHLINQQRSHLSLWLPWMNQIKEYADINRWLYDAHRYNLGGQHLTTFIQWQGVIVGSVRLMRIDHKHSRAELGYWINKQCQGQGIMTRCCQEMIRHSFLELQLNRLEIRSPQQNSRSRAMAQRLGFAHEGLVQEHIRLRGQFFNTEIFGLVYREWEKKQKKL